MMHLRTIYILLFAAAIACTQSAAQTQKPNPEELIKAFSAKETEFYEAWLQYAFNQTAEIEVLSVNGNPRSEKMTITSVTVVNDDGRSREMSHITGKLRSISFTPKDEEIIFDMQPFALTEKELPSYILKYEGKEHVDEIACFVFSVAPKSLKGDRLYFKGKIWVDDRDLNIVRTIGTLVPQNKEVFPEFETIRQIIDGRYWFPVWVHAKQRIRFKSEEVELEETIVYEDYKKSASKKSSKPEPVAK
jgi:hypothetical protein